MTDTNTRVKQTSIVLTSGSKAEARAARRYTFTLGIIAAVAAALLLYMWFIPTEPVLVGLLSITLMVALMMWGIPIGIVMAGVSALGLVVLSGPAGLAGTMRDIVFSSFASWSLSVIPTFVLMGIALGKSGLMSNAYDSARKLLGWLPGGLGVATTAAGAGMAATSGSTIGIVYAVGRVSIPEMIKAGYKPSLAMASTAMSGTLGQVIPPSLLLVVYAGVVETPVGPQLLAGIVPGLILALIFMIVMVVWATISPKSAPRGAKYSWSEKLASLVHLLPVLVIVLVVLGGLYLGLFTATEAGVVGAIVVLFMGLGAVIAKARRDQESAAVIKTGARRESTRSAVRKYLSESALDTVAAVAALFLLLLGVNMLTRVMTLSGLAQWVADAVSSIGLGRIGFLLLLIVIYIILGLFLDTLAMMLLTLPVFTAPLVALDVDLIWFGVFLIILAEIGMVTPPLGVLSFVVHAVGESSTKGMGIKLKLTDVFIGVIPFILGCLVLLVAMIFWPDIALWLPELSAS